MNVDVRLRCHGCATILDPLDASGPHPFRCPNAELAPNIDHLLVWSPETAGVDEAIGHTWPGGDDHNPFVRFRQLSLVYWIARGRGWSDGAYVELVERLNNAIATTTVPPQGFSTTSMWPLDTVSTELGLDIWAKEDGTNVAGSHKARHLMAILLYLEVAKVPKRTPLAIASCGNAALAAATLAAAVRRPLDVFVPVDANPFIVDLISSLGASVHACQRRPDDHAGDPCMLRFREALRHRGALPFSVQGTYNALSLDGGATLGHELADQLALLGAADELVIQVGGGALATATLRGLRDGVRLGAIASVPRVHLVQTTAAAPLHRAWRTVAENVVTNSLAQPTSGGHRRDHGAEFDPYDLFPPRQPDPTAILDDDPDEAIPAVSTTDSSDLALAAKVAVIAESHPAVVTSAMQFAVTHRDGVMWPWASGPSGPASVATGILDDETYDWVETTDHLLRHGGTVVVSPEPDLVHAIDDARSAGLPVNACATGAAGLGGVRTLSAAGVFKDGARVIVLLTGRER